MELLKAWKYNSTFQLKRSSGFWGSLMILLLCGMQSNAQHYDRGHISFIVGAHFYQRADIKILSGNFPITTKPAFGFNFGGTYTFNINTRFGVKTGFFVGLRTTNYQYKLDKDVYQLHNDSDLRFKSLVNFQMEIPLLFVYRFKVSGKYAVGFEAGGNLKIYNPGSFSSGISQYDSAFSNAIYLSRVEINVGDSSAAAAFDFQFKPFWHFLLKNNRIVHLALVANLPISKHPFDGTITFLQGSANSGFGTYSLRNIYVGIEFGYILTRVPNPKRQSKRDQPKKPDSIF